MLFQVKNVAFRKVITGSRDQVAGRRIYALIWKNTRLFFGSFLMRSPYLLFLFPLTLSAMKMERQPTLEDLREHLRGQFSPIPKRGDYGYSSQITSPTHNYRVAQIEMIPPIVLPDTRSLLVDKATSTLFPECACGFHRVVKKVVAPVTGALAYYFWNHGASGMNSMMQCTTHFLNTLSNLFEYDEGGIFFNPSKSPPPVSCPYDGMAILKYVGVAFLTKAAYDICVWTGKKTKELCCHKRAKHLTEKTE